MYKENGEGQFNKAVERQRPKKPAKALELGEEASEKSDVELKEEKHFQNNILDIKEKLDIEYLKHLQEDSPNKYLRNTIKKIKNLTNINELIERADRKSVV